MRTRVLTHLLPVAFLALTASLGGCGGSTSNAGGPDGSAPLPAIDASIARVQLDYVFLGGAPGCSSLYRTVDYDRKTRTMSWPACEADAGVDSGQEPSYASVTRVLSTSEAKSVENALATVTYVDHPTCGGEDGQEYYMTTFDAAGTEVRHYSARDINCYGYPEAANIVDVYAVLTQLRGTGP